MASTVEAIPSRPLHRGPMQGGKPSAGRLWRLRPGHRVVIMTKRHSTAIETRNAVDYSLSACAQALTPGAPSGAINNTTTLVATAQAWFTQFSRRLKIGISTLNQEGARGKNKKPGCGTPFGIAGHE